MKTLHLTGNKPLIGSVKVAGAKNSANKLLAASVFSNDEILFDNVPRIGYIEWDLRLLESIGIKYEWQSKNRLKINSSNINSFELPYSLGSKTTTSVLLAGPLLFRFGKAILPKPKLSNGKLWPINRLIETWESLGIEVYEDERFVVLRSADMKGGAVKFKIDTHIGTSNAILSTLALKGESTILNASQYPEISDLIDFVNVIGGNVKRTDDKEIKIEGVNSFNKGKFVVQPDTENIAMYMIATILTKGNVVIKNVKREHLLALANVLTKMGCKYEFSKNEVRVWSVGNDNLEPISIATAPAPGINSDWQSMLTVLLSQVSGESTIHETVHLDRFDHIVELNRMGAHIKRVKPSDVGLNTIISDDAYDYNLLGEPESVIQIKGPMPLKGQRITMSHLRSGASLFLAGLVAQGETELLGCEKLEFLYEDIFEKFSELGAQLEVVEEDAPVL